MTDDDICGAECTDGSDCQHPAGSCPVPSHSDPDADNPQGRPSNFTDELAREAIDAVDEVVSIAGVERKIGVGEKTINGDGGWLDQNPAFEDEDGNKKQFSPAFRRARGDKEGELIDDGLYDDDADTSMVKFLLSTSLGHKKTEKREVEGEHEHSGPDGNPLQVEVARNTRINEPKE